MSKPLGLLAAVVLAAAVVTGCGQSSEEHARNVADRVIEKDNLNMDCFKDARETANLDNALDKAQAC